ncbi:hypothetical protein K2173_006025 [Erythroxylum novogranatense]|uniref:Uncharacterized protein n=1 Tax=Erythroxylum novogranatense TaxID=1862640 RepID=A0AAV8TDH9_9ROSI|nr:hypothetical protein K2173_006025 [Erythroxylum novogranatense]
MAILIISLIISLTVSNSYIQQKLRETVESKIRKSPTGISLIGFPEQPFQEIQKQEQTPQDPRLAVIGGTNDNIGQKPVQVVVNGGEENPEEASKNLGSDWVISIKGKLKQAREDDDAISCSKLCIYKVPQSLRNGDDKAFIPWNMSLGPYHHGKKRLRQMDSHKWRFLHHVLKRTKLNVYLSSVKMVEEDARSCYEGSIPLSSNEFVEMMVLDGCFVLELFRGVDEGFEKLGYPTNDPIFARLGSMDSIQRDMINQLPIFILDLLLKLQYLGCRCQKDVTLGCRCQKDVAKLAVTFFDVPMLTDPTFLGKQTDHQSDAGLHCLEILWRGLLGGLKPDPLLYKKTPSPNSDVADERRHQAIYCATELKDSGIKFKEGKADRFWDIKFENGVLWIPRLSIDDGTKSPFLNLISFEQCHFDCSNYITSYVLFMDNLINSPMDVAHLHSCGIIEHWLGSDPEVADLFNRLCHEVVFDMGDNYLTQLWNTWKATLKQRYLNSPWAIISVIAAVVLLLLTFMQTFYGVYAY